MQLGGGRVLRSGDRPGIEQELWALLTLYQLLRMTMTWAVETRPGTDPDRASFTTALEAARDQLTAAAGSQPPRDWTGHELAILLGVPPRIMLTQLGTWARLGFFTRTGFGTYRLNTPPVSKSPRDAPGP